MFYACCPCPLPLPVALALQGGYAIALLTTLCSLCAAHCTHPLTGIAVCITWQQTALKAAVCHLYQLSTPDKILLLFLCPSAKSLTLKETFWIRGYGPEAQEGEKG